jgi:uncharacterized membrane protein YagU involved in acid resistance
MTSTDNVLRGAVAGVVSGLIASLAIKAFQQVWNTAQERATGSKAEGGEDQEDPPTVQLADRVAEAVVDRSTPEPLRAGAGELVHYATGALLGGVYGMVAEVTPAVTAGYGAVYGLGVDLVLEEALVPGLGLAPAPSETPAIKHAYALASHLVYGLVLEASRRAIRERL